MSSCRKAFTAFLLLAVLPSLAPAQKKAVTTDDPLLKGLSYRLVGPFRGGRSAAVTGVPGKPNLFYFGSCGGGVWRTRDRRRHLGKHLRWLLWRLDWRRGRQ